MSRIWCQLVSSPQKVPQMFSALQEIADRLKCPDTTVDIRGTKVGGFADKYDAFLHLDGAELLRLAMTDFQDEPGDVYALVNSLDPAINGLREILDVPVLTLMEVACPMSLLWGDQFGLMVPNSKMVPQYHDVVARYHLGQRMVGVEPLPFPHLLDLHRLYTGDKTLADQVMTALAEAAETLVHQGAEVLMSPGPVGHWLAGEGVTELAGARFIDMFGLLLKVSEGVAVMAAQGALGPSRIRRYASPPVGLLKEAFKEYNLGAADSPKAPVNS